MATPAKKATPKAKPKQEEEPVVDEKSSKDPILFQPLTDGADYPALVIYAYPTDVMIGIEKLTEKGTSVNGGYYGHSFESIIRGVDRTLFAYKLNNTQRKNMKVDEFLELLKEHKELMENFMKGEVKKCRSKIQ